jgi:predicted SprT family Zn-dependent metalloprotease
MIDRKTIDRLFSEWCGTWQVPDLPNHVTVKVSSRLSRSIARCYPKKKKIHLHREVPNSPHEFFREVLCHELAHIAVHELNGNGCRPHGREWKELVRKAGFEPRTRLPWNHIKPDRKQRKKRVYLHQCPICRTHRTAGRPMYRWRCRPCVESGLDGRLLVTRLSKEPPF